MGVLLQIQSDIASIKKYIELLLSPHSELRDPKGNLLNEKARQSLLAEYQEALLQLQSILSSGIVPPSYTSPITKITYFPSAEEFSHLKPPEDHSVFCDKRSRKKESLPQSEFNLFHSDGTPILNFLVEHQLKDSYPQGGFAKVKKAFSLETGKIMALGGATLFGYGLFAPGKSTQTSTPVTSKAIGSSLT